MQSSNRPTGFQSRHAGQRSVRQIGPGGPRRMFVIPDATVEQDPWHNRIVRAHRAKISLN